MTKSTKKKVLNESELKMVNNVKIFLDHTKEERLK